MALWPYSYFIALPFCLLQSFVSGFLSSSTFMQTHTHTHQLFKLPHKQTLGHQVLLYLTSRSFHWCMTTHSRATSDKLLINRRLCWCLCMHLCCCLFASVFVCMHTHYTYIAFKSALTSPQGSPRGRGGVKPGHRPEWGAPSSTQRGQCAPLAPLHLIFSFSHSTKHQCLVSLPQPRRLLFPL